MSEFKPLLDCLKRELNAKSFEELKFDQFEPVFRKCNLEGHDFFVQMRKKYQYLGSGDFRHVLRLNDDCVIKIPINAAGAVANSNEQEAWNIIKKMRNKKVLRHFAPVVSTGPLGSYLIMLEGSPKILFLE